MDITHGPEAELADWLRQERTQEAVRERIRRREAARYEGVAWSGLAPARLAPCLVDDSEAAGRLKARVAFRNSPRGRVLAAIVRAQRAAEAAYAAGESLREALARQSDGALPGCSDAADTIERQALEILAAARQVRAAPA